jgi:hypothetical protein
MKKRTVILTILAVLLIPFIAPWEGGRQSNGGKATRGITLSQADDASSPANFMPVLDWQMADLDVRDSQNQAISSPNSLAQIRDLFLANLFELAAVKQLHGIAQALSDVESFLHRFRDAIFNTVFRLSRPLIAALAPPARAVVHNVGNLWITFSVAVFLAFALFQLSLNKTPSRLCILRI